MGDNVRLLLEASKEVNSKAITRTRCVILALLAYFIEGLQYRQLSSTLGISDGNLNYLKLKLEGFVCLGGVAIQSLLF